MIKVYFAAPMLGDRSALEIAKKIVSGLKKKGYKILTEHVVEDVLDIERGAKPREIFERDIKLLDEADLLIAEVSYPSLGVGFEIAYFLLKSKSVLAFAKEERENRVSAMIRGITWDNFKFYTYRSVEDVLNLVDLFVNRFL